MQTTPQSAGRRPAEEGPFFFVGVAQRRRASGGMSLSQRLLGLAALLLLWCMGVEAADRKREFKPIAYTPCKEPSSAAATAVSITSVTGACASYYMASNATRQSTVSKREEPPNQSLISLIQPLKTKQATSPRAPHPPSLCTSARGPSGPSRGAKSQWTSRFVVGGRGGVELSRSRWLVVTDRQFHIFISPPQTPNTQHTGAWGEGRDAEFQHLQGFGPGLPGAGGEARGGQIQVGRRHVLCFGRDLCSKICKGRTDHHTGL